MVSILLIFCVSSLACILHSTAYMTIKCLLILNLKQIPFPTFQGRGGPGLAANVGLFIHCFNLFYYFL